MSIIRTLFAHDATQWVLRNIDTLPKRARFRAYNAIRNLEWADTAFEAAIPIPATYCALHATEEAVAAFVSCAKECGYGDDAKINIRDHEAKAAVSLLTQAVINALQGVSPAVAYHEEKDVVAARLSFDGEHSFGPASLGMVEFFDGPEKTKTAEHLTDVLHKQFKDQTALRHEVRRIQTARNAIFYANEKGVPTGFHEPQETLERECKIVLALVWGAIDLYDKKSYKLPLVVQALRTATLLIEDLKANKK